MRMRMWALGSLVAFASCGPLSSRDTPGLGGSGGVGASVQGGEGASEPSSGARAGKPTGGAGTATGGAAGSSGAGAAALPAQAGDGGGVPGESGGSTFGGGGGGGEGGEPEPVGPVTIATGQMSPHGIAVNAARVYWANRDAGTIVSCPLRGCGTSEPTVLASGLEAPLALTVDATQIYWVNAATSSTITVARIFKCPLAGCAAAPEQVTQWNVGNRVNDLHVAGGTLYVAAWPTLGSCPISGCSEPTPLGSWPYVAVDSDETFLYVGLYGTATLGRCPLSGCSDSGALLEKLATDVRPIAVTVDETNIYFVDHDFLAGTVTKHQISRCPLGGCGTEAPETVLAGDIWPYGLTQRGSRLYFTDVTAGTVVSISKP